MKEWLFHKDTREAVLFNQGEADTNVWMDSPDKCKEVVVFDRDALKTEADSLGISYPPNIKNERLLNMINEVKN